MDSQTNARAGASQRVAGDRGDGRDSRGHFVKGAFKGGPGRPPVAAEALLFKAARMLAPSQSAIVDHVELGRRYSGATMARLVEIATDPRTRASDAIAAAGLIFERCFGMAPQSLTTFNFNTDTDSATPEERQERVKAALENLRGMFAGRERTIEGEKS
jgi:hypothetical protein